MYFAINDGGRNSKLIAVFPDFHPVVVLLLMQSVGFPYLVTGYQFVLEALQTASIALAASSPPRRLRLAVARLLARLSLAFPCQASFFCCYLLQQLLLARSQAARGGVRRRRDGLNLLAGKLGGRPVAVMNLTRRIRPLIDLSLGRCRQQPEYDRQPGSPSSLRGRRHDGG